MVNKYYHIIYHIYYISILFHDSLTDTHEIAEAKARQNAKLREAFGIKDGYVDGSSFDPERRAKEAEAKAMAEKKYE